MNVVSTNNFSYRGEVSFSVNTKGHISFKKILNAGTKYLLDTITKALAGYSISSNVPRYLDVVQGSVKLEECRSCLISPLLLTGAVYGEAAEATVDQGVLLLNCIITYEDKSKISVLNQPRIVLKDSHSNILAYVDDYEIIQKLWDAIVDGSEALIEWKMIFTNKEK